jgi:hypothetical protein
MDCNVTLGLHLYGLPGLFQNQARDIISRAWVQGFEKLTTRIDSVKIQTQSISIQLTNLCTTAEMVKARSTGCRV